MESPLDKRYYHSTETNLYFMPCFTEYIYISGLGSVLPNFYNSLSELLLPLQC